MLKKILPVALSAALLVAFPSAPALAAGPNVQFHAQGHLGEVIVNPYRIAPLTAVIRNGGYGIEEATVRIVPKENGREIRYDVSRTSLLTYGGVPVFGLYPDYANKVEVSYTRVYNGKREKFNDTYTIYAAPVYQEVTGTPQMKHTMFGTKVLKVDPEFSDRLYLVNSVVPDYARGARAVWNNPAGGALEWNTYAHNAIIDTAGDIRWYMLPEPIFDIESIYYSGNMMGFQQTPDGSLSWGFGQRYVQYDLLGREVFNRRLPAGYSDFSHSLDNMPNGHKLLRVASSDFRRADGKRVHTIRDVIIEVDQTGRVVEEWKLWDILDPYRDNVLKVLDQGAVCLNIDASKAGQTLSAEEIAALDQSDKFGDVVGTGPGRNWAHVNSVDYDPTDDSIIISSRHQSAIVKIGRDKKVKWIFSSPEGWKSPWKEKLLTPVDKDGTPIKCENSVCEGGFDYTWSQHTAYRIDEKSSGDILYVSAFDNGDSRHMEQPPLPDMKYSRAVIYRIDQKKMTIEQVWEYGKDLGHTWYSPVTSITKYMADKDSVMVYSATAGLGKRPEGLDPSEAGGLANPWLEEFKWGSTTPSVNIGPTDTMGYQAMPIDLKKAFSQP